MPRTLSLLSLLLAVACAAGCSVTGRVQVNPVLRVDEYTTDRGIRGIGPITAVVEFRHGI